MDFDLLAGLDVANMDEKTVEILKMMGKTIGEAMTKYMSDTMSKKDFEGAIANAIKNIDTKEELKTLKEQLKDAKQCLVRMKGAMEKGADGVVRFKSLEEQIADQFKGFIKESNGTRSIDLRAAAGASGKKKITLFVDTKTAATTVTSASVAPHSSLTVDNALSVEPRANTILRQYANVAPVSTRSLTYTQFIVGNGDAAWVPEGGAKPMMDGTLEEKTVTAAKIALGAKITEETLNDLPMLVAEIREEIINKIGLKEEEGILNGTGVGGQIKGIASDVPAYNLTDVKISSPTIIDCIVAMYTQIISNSEQSYAPNVAMINPLDWANMAREKDKNGRPLNENINDILPTGLNLVVSTAVPKGTLRVGDFGYLNIRDYVALTIEFGWENDDFTKNLVTMIAEKRLMNYIKNQYKTAFVFDTIANVKTAITPA